MGSRVMDKPETPEDQPRGTDQNPGPETIPNQKPADLFWLVSPPEIAAQGPNWPCVYPLPSPTRSGPLPCRVGTAVYRCHVITL